MKAPVYIITVLLLLAVSCKKDDSPRNTGSVTIDNIRHMGTTYYVYGFAFSTGQLVSTENTPGPDITVDTVTSPPYRVVMQANSLRPSFHKYGDYADETAAKAAYDNLNAVTATTWIDIADPVLPNQVWLYRSGSDRYSKLRIISIERRTEQSIPVAEVTFEWSHQPDGSLNFP